MHVHSRQGLHARPAALFAQVANRFKSIIRVKKGRRVVDGKSIMGLLTLAASRGTTIEVTAQGADAEDAMHALEQMICKTEPPTVITVVRHRPSHGSTPPHPSPL
ncbi:MAG: HPr family phosphocarrier protein [Candidatus Omnitrophica bacterium]|nr:HPr family phosphocarrier protein [Candidatus Omnitrophota bacterium]